MRLEHRNQNGRSTLASAPAGVSPDAHKKPKCSLDTAGFVRHIPYPVKCVKGMGESENALFCAAIPGSRQTTNILARCPELAGRQMQFLILHVGF